MNKTKTGACQLCGQARMITLPDEEWKKLENEKGMSGGQVADLLATEQCNCKEAKAQQADRLMMERCSENIEKMFREHHPEIADSFQEAKELVWKRRIKKIAIATFGDGTAYMCRSGGKMEIRYVKKNETKIVIADESS